MWSHFCKAENAIVHINDAGYCDWCGVKEEPQEVEPLEQDD